MLQEITDSNFEEKVKKADSPFLLLLSSPWCGICKKVTPRIESLSEKYNKAEFGKMDITLNTQKPSELEVLSIPVIIGFKEGKERERAGGDMSEQQLTEIIERLL